MNPSWPPILLQWFDRHRRDLPWREEAPRNPYHVWISEIMLQQTRTEAVKPYYNAWMERFPTIRTLAEADEADVLRQWQGLGYYSRARNLHKAARVMMETMGGALPAERTSLEALPGIGAYTAGAVLSIGMGQREAAVDGNVLRVYARLYGIDKDILKKEGRKEVAERVEETLPAGRPGDFNEALMDLGSEVCIPKYPRCGACPLRDECCAFQEHRTESLPVRTQKKPQKEEYAACALIEEKGAFLMHLRPGKGMLASMWEFPMALGRAAEEAQRSLEGLMGSPAEEAVWTHRHVFTHRIWHMTAYVMAKTAVTAAARDRWRWIAPEEFTEFPLAGPHARLAAWVKDSNL